MKTLFGALLTALLAAAAGGVPADTGDQRQQLEVLRSRISALQAHVEAKSGEQGELSRLLEESELRIGEAARNLRRLGVRLERQRARLDQLHTEQQAQSRALAMQRTTLARQVRAAYAMGRQERLKILLNQQNPATFSRVMVYYDYLSRARAQKMQLIRENIRRLEETEDTIVEEQRELAQLHDRRANELAAMQQSQEERRAIVVQLARELKDQRQQLERLQSDERDLQALLRGIEEALADIPVENPQQVAFAGLRGRLPWPAQGRIVGRFGAARLGSLVWDGVMISTPEGREVRAVHHGRVAFADWLRGFGLLLIVDHGDGYMTLYGHNQGLFKEVGDWVEVNEPIALVGTSGGRERAGVYFGIRHQGRPVDPAKWCRRPAGSQVG